MDSLDALDESLDKLETALSPLLDKSLSETLEKLELLQKAKLQVLLPYVVNDLVFIYLKTRGIYPKTHPVVGELDRIKQYFDKIKNAEDPEKRRFLVDQGAAARFIKHAIKEAQDEPKRGTHTRFTETNNMTEPSQSAAVMPRISEAASAKIQAREAALNHDEAPSEESELEVFTESVPPESVGGSIESDKGKGKVKQVIETTSGNKRHRGMDPWTGYDENSSGVSTPVNAGKQGRNRPKNGSRPSAAANSESSLIGETEVVPLSDGLEQLPTRSTISTTKSQKIEVDTREVIDVDAFCLDIPGGQDAIKPQQTEVIDVDAIDTPSVTIIQKSRKKRKKKKKKTNISTSSDPQA